MKRVSAPRHPHGAIHKHLKLPTEGVGDYEACRSDTRLSLYIIKGEGVCATNKQFISIKLQVTDKVKISVHDIFANNAPLNATNFMTKPCKTYFK
jgi:hypothetical protein